MSNAARKARRARDRQHERGAIAAAYAIRGCICRPDFNHYRADGLRQVAVMHDDHCPAADTGSMLILGKGHRQTPEQWAGDILTLLKAIR